MMQIVNPQIIASKKVLLRLDLDVPLRQDFDGELSRAAQGKLEVEEDFRLRAGTPTLKLCIENASKVIVIGHLGRPEGSDPAFSLDPVREWFKQNGFPQIEMLENLRFNPGEESLSMDFAKELASKADIFVFEAFASHRPAVSTTILPTIMPHFCGLRFSAEVEKIERVRDNPKKPFIAIMGGAKVSDKLPVIEVLAKKADAVLVGGKLVSEIREQNLRLHSNVLVGKLTEDGFDIASETVESWEKLIAGAAQIVWNGPVGKFEDLKNDATKKIAEIILQSNAEIIIGGGDTIAALNQAGLLSKAEEKAFISTGGGAMLKLLSDGTLPTIEALA